LRTIRLVTINYFGLWETLPWNSLFILFRAFFYGRVGMLSYMCSLEPTASNFLLGLQTAVRAV